MAMMMNCGCPRCPVTTGRPACDYPKGVFGGLDVETALRHARMQQEKGGNPAGVLSDNGICQEAALSGSPVDSHIVERTEGSATVRVCTNHGREKCTACGRDFKALNDRAREDAQAKTDGEDAHRALAFQPRKILAWSQDGHPRRDLPELAPGTKVSCINRNELRRGEPDLEGVVLCTLVSEDFDGHDSDEDEHPHYRIRWLSGQGSDDSDEDEAKVLCDDVHDPRQWHIHDISVTSMLEALPGTSGSSRGRGTGSIALPADDIDTASLPSSVATSAVVVTPTLHSDKRLLERKITERDFQSAVKAHRNVWREQDCELHPGLPNRRGERVLLVHNDMVFCTDRQHMEIMITGYHMMKQGDTGLIHDLEGRKDLNGRVGTLLSYSDGRWGVDLGVGDEKVRVRLRSIKPAPNVPGP